MADHPKHALPIGFEIGGHRIVRVVGQGGFGIVYEAFNPDLDARVAVKEFYPSAMATRQENTLVVHNDRDLELFNRVLERFRDTARLQFKFDHPNILRVRNYIRGENTGYMVTDYVDGEPVRGALLKQGGHAASEAMFRRLFEPIVRAIGYVHGLGFLHRDISPENIMIDRSERPVLIDFGAIKRDLHSSERYSSVVFVREDYSPPEQQDRRTDRPEGFHTDIFALAGTMYFALSGMAPERQSSRLMARVYGNDGDPYVPIAKASKVACAPAVYAAIDRALKLPIRERPQSIEEFRSDLGWTDTRETSEQATVARTAAVSRGTPVTEARLAVQTLARDVSRSAAGIAELPAFEPDAITRAAFEAAERADTVAAWDAFLAKHPAGYLATLATARRTALVGHGPAALRAGRIPTGVALALVALYALSVFAYIPYRDIALPAAGLTLAAVGLAWLDVRRPRPWCRYVAASAGIPALAFMLYLLWLRGGWLPPVSACYVFALPAVAFWLTGHWLRRRASDGSAGVVDSLAMLTTVIAGIALIAQFAQSSGAFPGAARGYVVFGLGTSAGLVLAMALERMRTRTKNAVHNVGAYAVAVLSLLGVIVLLIAGGDLLTRSSARIPWGTILLAYGVPAALAFVLGRATRTTRSKAYRIVASATAAAMAGLFLVIEARMI